MSRYVPLYTWAFAYFGFKSDGTDRASGAVRSNKSTGDLDGKSVGVRERGQYDHQSS